MPGVTRAFAVPRPYPASSRGSQTRPGFCCTIAPSWLLYEPIPEVLSHRLFSVTSADLDIPATYCETLSPRSTVPAAARR